MPEFLCDGTRVKAIRIVDNGEWKTVKEFNPPVRLHEARTWYEENGYGEKRTEFW